jgi:hypothetical protein
VLSAIIHHDGGQWAMMHGLQRLSLYRWMSKLGTYRYALCVSTWETQQRVSQQAAAAVLLRQ